MQTSPLFVCFAPRTRAATLARRSGILAVYARKAAARPPGSKPVPVVRIFRACRLARRLWAAAVALNS